MRFEDIPIGDTGWTLHKGITKLNRLVMFLGHDNCGFVGDPAFMCSVCGEKSPKQGIVAIKLETLRKEMNNGK